MRPLLIAAGVCFALSPALSPAAQSRMLQATYSPQVSPTDVQAAITAAAPPDCSTPAQDTLSGTAGTSIRCMPRDDRTRPTAVQAINTTLAADCTWSVTFARPTISATPIVHALVVLPAGSTQPVPCAPTSRSTTGASGKCFPTQTSTLAAVTVVGVSVAVGSQVINPTASTCTAGMPVMVNVREPTQ